MEDEDIQKLVEFMKTEKGHRCVAKVNLYKNVFIEIYNVLEEVKQQANLSDDYKLNVLISNKIDTNLRIYFEEERKENENTGN